MVDHSSESKARVDYPEDDILRHWSPDSETYAPADVLLQYLKRGWNLEKLVAVETVYHAGYRRSDIYYFTLERDGRAVEMPILANPAVFRVIEQYQLTTMRINVDREGHAPVRETPQPARPTYQT